MFNSSNYWNWFKNQLVPNLREPSIIILDNAKYHKNKPTGTPNASKMKKEEVLKELERIGIEHDENVTSVEAKILLRK